MIARPAIGLHLAALGAADADVLSGAPVLDGIALLRLAVGHTKPEDYRRMGLTHQAASTVLRRAALRSLARVGPFSLDFDSVTTVGISILTAVVTAVLAVAGTYLTTRRDLQLKFDESLRDLRIGAYKELWEHLGQLAKYDRPEALSKSQAQTLRDSLRTWYFHTGGLVLSNSARQDYFTMLDGLELVISRPENIISDQDDEFLRILGSRLRTAMTRDVGTRRTFIFRGDPEREEPRLRRRTYKEDGGRRTLEISPKRRLNLAHLMKLPPRVIISGKPDLTMTNAKLLQWDWDPARRALTVRVAAQPGDGDAEERLFLLEEKDRYIVDGPTGWSRGEAARRAESVIWHEYDRTPGQGK